MAYRIRISGRAVREIGEARDWYEVRSLGLGGAFEVANRDAYNFELDGFNVFQ